MINSNYTSSKLWCNGIYWYIRKYINYNTSISPSLCDKHNGKSKSSWVESSSIMQWKHSFRQSFNLIFSVSSTQLLHFIRLYNRVQLCQCLQGETVQMSNFEGRLLTLNSSILAGGQITGARSWIWNVDPLYFTVIKALQGRASVFSYDNSIFTQILTIRIRRRKVSSFSWEFPAFDHVLVFLQHKVLCCVNQLTNTT